MGSAVPRPVNILVGMSLGRARPGRVFLVAGPVADAFEARRVSDRRRWWRRCLVSFIERERVTVESKALAVPVGSNDGGNLSFNGRLADRVSSLKDGDRSRVWKQLYANRAIESSGRTYSLAVSLSSLSSLRCIDVVRRHLSTRYTWPIRNLWNSEQVQLEVTGNAYDRTIIATSYEDLVPVRQRDPMSFDLSRNLSVSRTDTANV